MFVFCSLVGLAGGARGRRPRPQPEFRPRLLARFDAGGDENLQRPALLQRSIKSSPTHTNSRPGSFMHTWITWSSAFLTQALSGTSPSCVACSRSVSLVARLTWLTKGDAGTENA